MRGARRSSPFLVASALDPRARHPLFKDTSVDEGLILIWFSASRRLQKCKCRGLITSDEVKISHSFWKAKQHCLGRCLVHP